MVCITGNKNTEEIVPVTPAEIKTADKVVTKPSKDKPAATQDSSADGSASGDESGESGESGDEDESGDSAESGDEEESGESGDEEESGETAEGEVTKRSVVPSEKTGEIILGYLGLKMLQNHCPINLFKYQILAVIT